MQDVEQILHEASEVLTRIEDAVELEQAKARYLGRGGSLTEQLKSLGGLAPEERKSRGSLINQAKDRLERLVEERRKAIQQKRLYAQLAQERLDVTLPGRGLGVGGVHPTNKRAVRAMLPYA